MRLLELLEKQKLQNILSIHAAAADNGTSAQQLLSFYGWKSVNMPQE